MAASRIFDFVASRESFLHERREIFSPNFTALRRNLNRIISRLSQTTEPEAVEVADEIRALLFKWLSTPVEFSDALVQSLLDFGTVESFEARWGFQGEFKGAVEALHKMATERSRLRCELAATLRELAGQKTGFTIFCHKRAREHFDSILAEIGDGGSISPQFLHTIRDYAEAQPFSSLIKVGPLRARGWGAVPDSILSAPRYEKLIQFVWSGCADEQGFGYDPVAAPPVSVTTTSQSGDSLGNQISWKQKTTASGVFAEAPGANREQDEFAEYQQILVNGGKRNAVLLELPDGDGILYSRNSEILSFDPTTSSGAVAGRSPSDGLTEGMFIIHTHAGNIPLGDNEGQETGLFEIWKARLREELKSSPEAFCGILKNKGLELQSLRLCVENWAVEPHTVIHAPQKRRHFQILIDALSIDPATAPPPPGDTRPFWQRAWEEILITRGEAIHTGRQEHELAEQKTVELLSSLAVGIRKLAVERDGFLIHSPNGADVRGTFVFFKVLRIEDDFMAPDSELKVIRDLDGLEKWKVT